MRKVAKQYSLIAILVLLALSVTSTTGLAVNNLVQNPGFEEPSTPDAIPGWVIFSGSFGELISVASDEVYAGSKALVFNDPSTSVGVGLRSQPLPAKPGDGYIASVYTYNSPGSRVFLYLDFWDSSNKRLLAKTASSKASALWEELVVEAQAPEGTVAVSIILFSQAANVGIAHFDEVTLINVTEYLAR